MLELIVKRLLQFIPVLIGIVFFAFLVFYFTPGDPARIILREAGTEEDVQMLRAQLGLDKPFHVQFGLYMHRLLQGDLGSSYRSRQSVSVFLFPALVRTMQLSLVGMVFMLVISIPIGIYSAVRQNSLFDYFGMSASAIGLSAPVFWIGLLLIYIFGYKLRWFPISGAASWNAIILPALSLGLHFGAQMARMTRTCMLEVLGQEYIRTARSKGLSEFIVIAKHALRNAALPMVTIAGLNLGHMLGGAVLTETVFAWPGVGRLLVEAIFQRDAPVVQGGILFVALLFCTINLIVDLSYGVLNPAVRYK